VTHGMSMQETCPVHVIGPVLDSVAHGSKLFGGATAANASHIEIYPGPDRGGACH
jgi:hypothetical protein